MKRIGDNCRTKLYAGKIARAAGDRTAAYVIWADMVQQEPNNWLVYSLVADRYAEDGRYEEAIRFYQKAYELQPSPKYTDAAESIAHIYEIIGEYQKAVAAWEELIRQLAVEWQITEGEAVDRPQREIARLRGLMN